MQSLNFQDFFISCQTQSGRKLFVIKMIKQNSFYFFPKGKQSEINYFFSGLN